MNEGIDNVFQQSPSSTLLRALSGKHEKTTKPPAHAKCRTTSGQTMIVDLMSSVTRSAELKNDVEGERERVGGK